MGVGARDGIERLAPARQYTVLYVDDEPDNLLVFKAVLGDEFKVTLAQSAAEALETIAREPVAVLVADQRMPHVSGIELCHMVSERLPAVRRILLTAYSDHQTAITAINRGGVHGYLEKPWDPLTMRRVLWDAVNRVHLDRTLEDLRTALAERDARLDSARSREKLLHDMANAANRLSLSAHVLRRILDRQGQALPSEVHRQLEREADVLGRAATHLGQLQEDRAASAGALAPRVEPLRLDELLRTVSALSAFPPGDRLRLSIDVPPGAAARADRIGITRVLVNLVHNARQAIENSGEATGQVRVVARDEGERVVLEVSDTGPGVPPALRERVFEEFFTTRRGAGGTGLGLSAAREVAHACGGDLELPLPQPERGALFRLTLPSGKEAPSPRTEPGTAHV